MAIKTSKSIRDLIKLSRKTFLITALFIAFFSTFYLIFANKKYQTFMVIIPETNGISSAESAVESALSSFGSIGGALDLGSLGGSDDPQFKKVLYLMHSQEVSKILINENPEIIDNFFIKKQFDIKKKEFQKDSFLVDSVKTVFGMKYFNNNAETIVSDELKKVLKISKDNKTKFTILSIDHENPIVAKALLQNIYKIAEDIVKKETRDNSLKKIEYFESSLASGNLSTINATAFTKMANIEYQKFALSSSDAPFASQIIQNPTIAGKPVSPNVYLVVFISFVIWLVISTLIISLRYEENEL